MKLKEVEDGSELSLIVIKYAGQQAMSTARLLRVTSQAWYTPLLQQCHKCELCRASKLCRERLRWESGVSAEAARYQNLDSLNFSKDQSFERQRRKVEDRNLSAVLSMINTLWVSSRINAPKPA